MILDKIVLTSFRCFNQFNLQLDSNATIIAGANGSGKTSILEAIYLLGYMRSFRTHKLGHLIGYDQGAFTLFSKLSTGSSFGVEKGSSGDVRRIVDGASVKANEFVSQFLPILFIDSSSHRLFTNQSVYRRQLLDWGVYYVDPLFGSTWNKYQQILKQRNSLLKQRAPTEEIKVWDSQLVMLGEKINSMRRNYAEELDRQFQKTIESFELPRRDIKLQYYCGWEKDKSLATVLTENLYNDIKLGYTQYGPQRAKIDTVINSDNIKYHFSEGQQKIVHYAIKVAQSEYLKEKLNKKVLFLVDDLSAELDINNQTKLIRLLENIENQVIITTVKDEISKVIEKSYKTIHLE